MNELCKEIEETLIEWGFTELKIVTFDSSEQDIVINGQKRKSNGKGFSIFYAAFSVSLMNYLLSKNHLFSRVLLLDSPVTTLKEEEIEKGNIKEGDIIENSARFPFCFII